MTVVIDLFAGAGGWDVAAEDLGHVVAGIEIDEHACATRAAAGLRTVRGDVAAAIDALLGMSLTDTDGVRRFWEAGEVAGVIGSPPCPTYSSAGGRAGQLAAAFVVACMHDLVAGRDTRAERTAQAAAALYDSGYDSRERCIAAAAMSMLVVEPLRWTLALAPEWVALEQVPPVLGLWSVMAELLAFEGYSVWTGILEAERYGVPQTRERAFLLASRTRTVTPPQATHQRYVRGTLPRASEDTLDGRSLRPWISVTEALEISDMLYLEHTQRDGTTGEYAVRSVREPAFTVASNVDRWKLRPAPTITATPRSAGGLMLYPDWRGADAEPATKITLPQAAVLQSFPADYPFAGNLGQRGVQIANAVPPRLARAVLETVAT